MSWKNEYFEEAVELLRQLPNETQFDIGYREKILEFQASTRDQFRNIRDAFPGLLWTKTWRQELDWWQFDAKTTNGWKLHVYACREKPPVCKAITEKKVVKRYREKVPAVMEEYEEEKEVIVGWDCKPEPEDVAATVERELLQTDDRQPHAWTLPNSFHSWAGRVLSHPPRVFRGRP